MPILTIQTTSTFLRTERTRVVNGALLLRRLEPLALLEYFWRTRSPNRLPQCLSLVQWLNMTCCGHSISTISTIEIENAHPAFG
jgi:hypothetical protein